MRLRPSTLYLFLALGIAIALAYNMPYIIKNPVGWIQFMGLSIFAVAYILGLLVFLVWWRERTTMPIRFGFGLWNLMLMAIGAFLRLFGDMALGLFAWLSK